MVVAVEETLDHATQTFLADTHSGRTLLDYLVRQLFDSCYSMTSCSPGSRVGASLESGEILPCTWIRVSFSPPLSTLHRAWTHQIRSPTIDLVLFPSSPSHPNRCQCSCLLLVTEPVRNHSTKPNQDDPGLPRLHLVASAGHFFAEMTFFPVELPPLLQLSRRRTGISIYLRKKQR